MFLDWQFLMYIFTYLILQITATDSKENRNQEIRFEAIGPEKPIFGKVGEDVILELQLKPPISAKRMEIQINKDTHDYPLVYLYKEGTDSGSTQDPHFKGRTFLRTDNIHEGHFDLLIRDVVLLDNGSYVCYVRSKSFHSKFLAYIIVSEPLLQNSFFSPTWPIVVAVLVALVPILVAVLVRVFTDICLLCFFKPKPRDTTKTNDEGKQLLLENVKDPQTQNLQNYIAPFSTVDIVLDNSNTSSKLWVSKDQKSVRLRNNGPGPSNPCNEAFANSFVLGSKGFTHGKYRWELEVGCAKPWAVGIALESVSQTGLSRLAPDEGVWTVGLTAGQYQAFTSPITALSLKDRPEKLEVYLDVDGGQLSFYYSGTRQHIYSHIWHYTEKVLPFIWTMDPINLITVFSSSADGSTESA